MPLSGSIFLHFGGLATIYSLAITPKPESTGGNIHSILSRWLYFKHFVVGKNSSGEGVKKDKAFYHQVQKERLVGRGISKRGLIQL